MSYALVLIAWSVLASTWWLVAWWLTRLPVRDRTRRSSMKRRQITIFKPVPRLASDTDTCRYAACIRSFVDQLDDHSELLLGIHEEERSRWAPYLERWNAGAVRPIFRCAADRHPNPKVAWQCVLAQHAKGTLWLWSDADIMAPPGYLATASAEMEGEACRLLTNAYVIQDTTHSAGLLEALFVNVEFYPGVRLLDRLDAIRFGFGAGMLFRADDFRARASWSDLGGCLAEDYELGRRLQPVRLSSIVLRTFAHSARWTDAYLRYLRWQKTIRWCRPRGFAAQLLIHPMLGWLAWIVAAPGHWAGWAGLLTVWLAEMVAACAICRSVGCRIGWSRLWAVAGWSVVRSMTWTLCWLPCAVRWQGQRWWAPHQRSRDRRQIGAVAERSSMVARRTATGRAR